MLCTVIGGVDGLNIGKRVTAGPVLGEHSKYGTIRRCSVAPGGALVTEYGAVGISADFAEDWLEPVLPPPLPAQQALRVAVS